MKKVAMVRFENSSKYYSFYTHFTDLKIGQRVVVDCATGLQVVTFMGYSEEIDNFMNASKWIVCKVDMQSHRNRMIYAEQFENLERELESMRQSLEKEFVYQMLAERDEEFAEKLARLNHLENLMKEDSY